MGNGILNAFTDEERVKLSNLGGVSPFINAHLSIDQTITTEAEIVFDTVIANEGITLSAGVFTIPKDGYYDGNMNIYVDKTGTLLFNVWVECKPFSTGVWQLCGGNMVKLVANIDGGQSFGLSGAFPLSAGDEVRVMTESTSGNGSLEKRTQVVTLGTVTQWPAVINFRWISEK